MTKPTHDLTSSKSLQKSEQPKSVALSIMPKRSLNPDVDAWVAAGGQINCSQVIATDPQSKPITPQTVRSNHAANQQSVALRAKILSFAREYGRPFIPLTVAKNLDISCQKASYHLIGLQMDGRVESFGKLGRNPLYEVVK